MGKLEKVTKEGSAASLINSEGFSCNERLLLAGDVQSSVHTCSMSEFHEKETVVGFVLVWPFRTLSLSDLDDDTYEIFIINTRKKMINFLFWGGGGGGGNITKRISFFFVGWEGGGGRFFL